MKQNLNIIREILKRVEDHNSQYWVKFKDLDFPREELIYNAFLLKDAGYIEADDTSSKQGMDIEINRMTHPGHQFFESIKSDNVWNKTSKFIVKKGGNLALSMVKEVAISIARKELGLN